MQETELYAPVRALLIARGFDVKAEVGPCDVVGLDADGTLVIVEMKTNFALTLFHQAVERLAMSDQVFIAVPKKRGRAWLRSLRRNLILCRRLGLGLILVADGEAQVRVEPGPYKPRGAKARRARVLKEFSNRKGDPNVGGMTGKKIMTSYRQDAIACAQHLAANGAMAAREVAAATGVTRARTIMYANLYGWFCRPETAVYDLTPEGAAAISEQS